ncbi:MAG: ATP-binding protein [Vulcanimicrobiota bacterium]
MRAVLATVCLALGVVCLVGGPGPRDGPLLLVFAVFAMALEARAVALPVAGVVSLAWVFVLGAAIAAGLGTAAAVLLLLAVLTVRFALSPRRSLEDFVMDALPALAASASLLLVPGELVGRMVMAAVVWAATIVFLPGLLVPEVHPDLQVAWGRARNEVLAALASLGLAGGVVALLAGQQRWSVLLVGVILLALSRPLRLAAESPLPSELRATHHHLQRALDTSQALESSLRRVEKEKATASAELRLLRRLGQKAGRSQSFGELAAALVEVAQEVAPLRSAALFLEDGRACYCDSPDRERLESASLLELDEPLVERCRRDGQALYGKPPGESIFRGDAVGAALPVGRAVLYLGRGEGEFDASQRQRLELLAESAAGWIQMARARDAEQSARTATETALERLSSWADRLSALLNGARILAGELEPARLFEHLEDMLRAVLPHQRGCFLRLADGRLEPQRVWPEAVDPEAALALGEAILQNGRPLLIEEAESSRFAPLYAGQQSFLGVPAESQYGLAGVLMVAGSRPGLYQREDQEFLYLVGLLTAVAYRAANTHHRLKESQAQLVQAGKMAAVGQLAAGVAHELNTPLGAVMVQLGSASLNLERERYDRAADKLASAEKAAEKAREIIAKLLFYSREAQRGRRRVDLNQVVNDTLALLGSQLTHDEVVVRTELSELPSVLANQNELQQVVTNLLLNARDAVLEPTARGKEIVVSTGFDGQAVRLAVADQGPGLAPEVVDRLFEPFFTTKPVGKGTGLGLSVSQQIVTQHEGSLSAANRPEGGAVFEVRLAPARGEEPR